MPSLLERAIDEINDLEPDVVICSGDLTTFGFRPEYQQAREYLDKIECESLVVIPGNHDSRNVGYVHFEDLFGEPQLGAAQGRRHDRRRRLDRARPRPRPDRPRPLPVDRGAVRRARPTCASSSCTTTCCRSRARAASATSSTTPATRSSACSARASTSSSAGHKHVPYAWRLENLFIVNAGTVSSLRLRGQHAALLQRDRGRRARTSTSGAATRTTGRRRSSSSRPRRASSRSTRRGSRTRSRPRRERRSP